MVIPANAKHKALAWEFLKFLGSEEAQYLYGVQGRFFPPQRQAGLRLIQESRSLRPAHLSVLTTLNMRPLPVVPGFSELRNMWQKELAPVFAGTLSAKSAGKRIDQLSADILAKATTAPDCPAGQTIRPGPAVRSTRPVYASVALDRQVMACVSFL